MSQREDRKGLIISPQRRKERKGYILVYRRGAETQSFRGARSAAIFDRLKRLKMKGNRKSHFMFPVL
jgi:hypothetical protein